jgi:YD repeat-containing protein
MAAVRTQGPTPNGGAYAVASFMDADGNPVEQADATQLVIVEYDSADRMLAETVGTVGAPRLTRGVRARSRLVRARQ